MKQTSTKCGIQGIFSGTYFKMVFRRRITKDSIEESIIDHVLVSGDLADYLESILIDEERLHVLTRLTKTKKGVVKKQSDHNVIISKFYFQWNKKIK